MHKMFNDSCREKSSCGVGLLAALDGKKSFENLQTALLAAKNVEHRGGGSMHPLSGDGVGIMTNIPFELIGAKEGEDGVATLFVPIDNNLLSLCLRVFEKAFEHYGLEVYKYREVPTCPDAINHEGQIKPPKIYQAFIRKPKYCRTLSSFDKLMYLAKQKTKTHLKEHKLSHKFFLVSLSSRTIIYKALTNSYQLEKFYPDLLNPLYKINYAVFHRRFSTNTISTWDKVQPFRLMAHNGEINTISGNRLWARAREKSLGLRDEELIASKETSDSGSLNTMVEALKYRSSIPHLSEVLSLLIPPANKDSSYYKFWGRALEPWDGPALVSYCDGKTIGARLDRNGFRPCRWARTDRHFYLASEAGSFELDESQILEKGYLSAGKGVSLNLLNGVINFEDVSENLVNKDVYFDSRVEELSYIPAPILNDSINDLNKAFLLGSMTYEDFYKIIKPMAITGKDPIGSMGDTASIAVLSKQDRSLFDYFYQRFAQVTNPPLDYIREGIITELSITLGRSPNVFEPKELLPLRKGILLKSPILSLGQIENLYGRVGFEDNPIVKSYGLFFNEVQGEVGLNSQIMSLVDQVISAIRSGTAIIILSDRGIKDGQLPIPSLLALRAIHIHLNKKGIRLRTSIIIDSSEIKNSHEVACLLSFGATAICPYLALKSLYIKNDSIWGEKRGEELEKTYIKALEGGLLKIMAKMGISVVDSYISSELFDIIGLGSKMTNGFFPGHKSIVGGLELDNIINYLSERSKSLKNELQNEKLVFKNIFLYKEPPKSKPGEAHAMTTALSRIVHDMTTSEIKSDEAQTKYKKYLDTIQGLTPIHLRNLFNVKNLGETSKEMSIESILKTFGSGAMSFGSISAESQRDIIHAFKEVGGRSNSGEGGENPYYFEDGICADIKQIASGRFGVTTEYLVTGNEIQIKIAQGAKPGEGGQLLGKKVNADIAKARYATVGMDLISPPPMHDIYSIEDLKQLIYEFKQLKPGVKVSVKLVSSLNIGAIAVGVVKAGADIIHISGGDGGTGAAALLSMKHCGLPFEFGLSLVYNNLLENKLLNTVTLRTDGGIQTGQDIIMAAILGANEFDFGKLLLIAEGCIMARVCEKNTCPTGIATQDPKFKKRYVGTKEKVVTFLRLLAKDVQTLLLEIGASSLSELRGRTDLLILNTKYNDIVEENNLDLSFFKQEKKERQVTPVIEKKNIEVTSLNIDIDKAYTNSLNNEVENVIFKLKSTDRAVLATLNGRLAIEQAKARFSKNKKTNPKEVIMNFEGSAGQGFASFLMPPLIIKLVGESNDFLAKSMVGGQVIVTPANKIAYTSSENGLVGNCCLYGATGGRAYLKGQAGDRFAIRNSGALAIVEGIGMHGLEYMTGGVVVLLGSSGQNLGAGMTGGVAYSLVDNSHNLNQDYVGEYKMNDDDYMTLEKYLRDYVFYTDSILVKNLLDNWKIRKNEFFKYAAL